MTKRKFVTYLVFFIVSSSGMLFMWFSFQVESLNNIRTVWRVDEIFIDKEDKTDKYYFKVLNFNCLVENELYFPILKNSKVVKKATWKYYRTGLNNATVEMINTSGNLDGVYNIEFIVHSAPRRIRFYSKNIEFVCTEMRFTIDNTSIQFDPFDLPEKEE